MAYLSEHRLVCGDLGRYPLYVVSYVQCMRYWLRLLDVQEENYLKRPFNCYPFKTRMGKTSRLGMREIFCVKLASVGWLVDWLFDLFVRLFVSFGFVLLCFCFLLLLLCLLFVFVSVFFILFSFFSKGAGGEGGGREGGYGKLLATNQLS